MYVGTQKNFCRVFFSQTLDLAPFCTTGHLTTEAKLPISTYSPESSTNDPRYHYKLRAVIVHYGTSYDGHFITYRLHSQGPSESWWRVSDEKAHPVTVDEVFRENPYLLFYEKMLKVNWSFTESLNEKKA